MQPPRSGSPHRDLRSSPAPSPRRARGPGGRVPVRAVALLVAAPLWGCDLPTELPRWDTLWEATLLADTVSTAELLPDEMRLGEEGFVLDHFESGSRIALADVCELCTCFDGPVPDLAIGPEDREVRLPNRVLEERVVRGTAELTLVNELSFDILDDGQGGRGFLRVDLMDSWSGEVFETVVAAEPLPPGDSVVLSFELPPMTLSSRVVARVTGQIPGTTCDVDLGPEDGFRVNVALRDVVASDVLVILADQDLAPPSRDLELPGFLSDRLRPGDAEVVVEVSLESRLPAGIDLRLSAAGRADRLFTGDAALFTPLVIEAAGPVSPRTVTKEFLLDLEDVEGSDRLYIAGDSRVLGSRIVRLVGGESVSYRMSVRATVPTR